MSPAIRRCTTGACLLILAALASHIPALQAQPAPAQAAPGQESLVREGLSEDAAVALVRGQTDGKVVRVDRRQEGGSLVYRVRVVKPDGRLREYRVDAATGTVR